MIVKNSRCLTCVYLYHICNQKKVYHTVHGFVRLEAEEAKSKGLATRGECEERESVQSHKVLALYFKNKDWSKLKC